LGLLLALGLIRTLPDALRFDVTWLGIAAAFFVFSLPAFFWLPGQQAPQMSVLQAARGGISKSWRTFREILGLRETRRFLLAYLFYEDGVNTVIVTAGAYASKTVGFETEELIILFAVVQICALAGAFAWAKPADRLGPKRVVMAMLVQWSLVVMAAYFVQTKMHFWIVAVLAGTGLGAIQSASRAFMSTLVPKGREGDFFGFYHLCGKSAAILGPLVFGAVSAATGGDQRTAILSVLVFFVIGAFLLARVRAGGPTHQSQPATQV
ncbi:MAG TPA: MFS transporter, partial [Candidatus Acidoferrales bacterium]